MGYDREQMRVYRVETGRSSHLTVPISVLATLLAQPDARSILHHHFGPSLCRAIERAPKARREAA
jgi:hypothetical protein